MNFENIKSDEMKFEYKVVFTADEIEKQISNAVAEKAKTFKMQGFRTGHVPLNIVRNNVENTVMKDVFDELISEACDKIIKELKAQDLASKPTYHFDGQYEKGKDISLTMSIEVAPSFELKPYQIELTKIVPNVRKEDIDKSIKDFMYNLPVRENAEDGYAIQHRDEISYKAICYINGVENKKRSFSESLILPSEIPADAEFLLGFVGKKAKESFDFVPKTEKNTKYTFIIKNIKRILGELSQEDYAVKKGFENFATFEAFVKENIGNDIVSMAFLYHKNQILEALATQYKFSLPKSVLELEMKNIINNVKKDLEESQKKGTASEEDLKKTDAELEKEYSDVVSKRVLLGYVLNKIAKEEGITASEEELKNAIMREVNANPVLANHIVHYYQNSPSAVAYKRAEIIEAKVVNFLISKAKSTETPKTIDEVEAIVADLLED